MLTTPLERGVVPDLHATGKRHELRVREVPFVEGFEVHVAVVERCGGAVRELVVGGLAGLWRPCLWVLPDDVVTGLERRDVDAGNL